MQSFLEGVVNIELKTGRICNELLEALKEGNVFFIRDGDIYSYSEKEPISFCPFCGKKLKER